MPPRRSTTAARKTTSVSRTRSSTTRSTTQDDSESRISISSDSMPDIIPNKRAVKKGVNKIVRKVKVELDDSDDELSLESKVVKRAVKKAESSDDVMLIDDEETKAKLRAASPNKRSAAKVRPPTPGTPEYEQLEPITFAKDYMASKRDVSTSKPSAKRVKVEAAAPGTPAYMRGVISKPVKMISTVPAATATPSVKRKRLVESSDIEVTEDSDGEDKSQVPERIRHNDDRTLHCSGLNRHARSIHVDDESEEPDQSSEEHEEEDQSGGNISDSSDASDASDASDPFVDHPKASAMKGKMVEKEQVVEKAKAVKKGGDGNVDKSQKRALTVEQTNMVEQHAVGDKSQQKTQINETTVYLEDLHKPRFVRDEDEAPEEAVMQISLQDHVLLRTYKDLPWLKPGILLPWGENDKTTAPSPIWFQIWQSILEPYDEAYLLRWITFQQAGRYINMSRVDPNNITTSLFGSQRFLVLPGSNNQCICISLIYVYDCFLVSGKHVGNTRTKKVGGVLHIQEMERLAACFCMQYDSVAELNANAFGWVLYFNTRNEDFESKSKKNSPVKSSGSASTSASGFSFFSKYPGPAPKAQPLSPSKSAAIAAATSAASSSKVHKALKPILDFHDIVPIYDGRKPEFEPLLDLDNVSKLPLWEGGTEEAPRRSLGAVGYTAHTYKNRDGVAHLSFNVQWLVVLGVSEVGNNA